VSSIRAATLVELPATLTVDGAHFSAGQFHPTLLHLCPALLSVLTPFWTFCHCQVFVVYFHKLTFYSSYMSWVTVSAKRKSTSRRSTVCLQFIYYYAITTITTACTNLTRNVAAAFGRHGMPPPASNDTGTTLGQDGSD